MRKKRGNFIDGCGLKFLLQIQEQGVCVAPQLEKLGRQDLITVHTVKQAETLQQLGLKPQHKYRVSAKDLRTLDGIVFASKREMLCYKVLRDSGCVFHLQPEFELQPAMEVDHKLMRAVIYKGDFLLGPPRLSATEPLRPDQVVIDVKGFRTQTYMLKRKMVAAKYGRQIVEIDSVNDFVRFLQNYKNENLAANGGSTVE